MFLATLISAARVPLLRSAVVAVVALLSRDGLGLTGTVRLRFPEGKPSGLNGSGLEGA
jgi:hypothetical protein